MANLTVLVVDDDPTIVRAVTRRLSRAGHNVIGCSDGEAAMAEVRARADIDVVVTDLHLGTTNGSDLVREILEHRPQMQAIILTGSDIALLDELEAVVLQKPVRGSQLLRVIAHRDLPLAGTPKLTT